VKRAGERRDPRQHTTADRGDPVGSLVLMVAVGGRVTSHELPPAGVVTLGRDPACEIGIVDASVSRRHARLHVGRNLYVEDLGSRHGTIVTDAPIEPGVRVQIVPGQALRIGDAIAFLQGAPARADASPTIPDGVVCADPVMVNLFSLIGTIADSDLPVVLLGETGTGKEVLASALHRGSARRGQPMLAVNCASFSGSLLESELFGHERGAFTGALALRKGVFETADGGTLMLDEIGELPLDTQAKLLRVLESGELMRLGASEPRRVDIRYIAATSRDLPAMVADGSFRADLYFRLNGFTFKVPALRDRVADILPLARHFAGADVVLAPEAEQALVAHPWPGNVRELRRTIERARVLARGGVVGAAHLCLETSSEPDGDVYKAIQDKQRAEQRKQILSALEATDGNQTLAAKRLGISRRTLVARLAALDIPRPRKR
jgi:two-component system, NtrC family, response regulator AtoC